MLQVELKHFHESYFSDIMSLEQQAFPLDAYSPEILRKRIEEYPEGFFVAIHQKQIIGYIAAWIIGGKARIDSMSVDKDYRMQGVGSKMLGVALDHFKSRGFQEVELEVRPTNKEAINLYIKFGFVKVGIKRHFYQSDGSDALLMKASFKV